MKNIKKTVVRTLSAALAAALCGTSMIFAPVQPVSAATSNATTQRLNDQIETLDKQMAELKNKIKSIDKEAAATLENKQYYDSLVTTINAKIQAAEQLTEELTAQINETNAKITEHEALIAETSEKIKERMRQNHEDGNANYLNVLIGAEGVGDFLSRLERINTMIEYDSNTLEDYEQKKAELEAEKASLENSKALQEQTLKSLNDDKKESEILAEEAANFLSSLQDNKAAATSEYEKAAAASNALDAQLEAELARIHEEERRQQQAANQGVPTDPGQAANIPAGKYMWPLPSGGYISCYFGGLDPGGKPHYGTDIAIAYGTPIYAAGDGTVVTAASHSSYGNYVVINHGGGQATLYAHCSSLAVGAGQTVSKGQVIGYVGSTGYSTGNHLHLEFRVNGARVNALSYIPR